MFLRSISIALLFTLFVTSAPPPAEAVVYSSRRCEDGFGRIADLVRNEQRHGVTSEWLAEINDLVPFLIDCVTSDPDGEGPTQPGESRWGPLVASYFRIEDVPRAICLMRHESKGIATAVNPSSGAAGLMQVMPFWAGRFGYRSADLLDPMVNLEVASWIRDRQGWSAWSPYNRGLCR